MANKEEWSCNGTFIDLRSEWAWVALQPLSRQRPISVGMYNTICIPPSRVWLPGGASGTAVAYRLLWTHGHGDFQKWFVQWSQPEMLSGTSVLGISGLDGKKPEEVSD